jgi:glycosyltransferase involved in cell wall biosynthesis
MTAPGAAPSIRSSLRVLQLLPSLEVGGMEFMVVRLAEALSQRGMQVCLGELTHRGRLDPGGAFEHTWVGGLREASGAKDGQCYWRLWRYLARECFSVVHVHNTKSCCYLLPAAVLTRTPVVYTVHGCGSEGFAFARGMVRVHRFGAPWIARYVAVSDAVQRRLVRTDGVPESKVTVIRNGVDAAVFAMSSAMRSELRRRVRQRHGIPQEAFVVGSVGRFATEKNYPLLVKAFARMPAPSVPTMLLLVGDGPDRVRIEAAIERNGVAHRCLLAGIQTDVRALLAAMDVFCLSSDTEGTSLTLLEAGASGVPCVVTDVGGNAEVVKHGVTGLVVPAGDAHAMQAALFRLLANPTERSVFGVAAADRIAQRYSMAAMVSAYEAIYRATARE